MSQQFKEQGGAATMDPGLIRRWLTSKMMSTMSSEARQQKARDKAEQTRAKLKQPHTVEYFHQVDDGYSHLAVQVLDKLAKRYKVQLRCHLVGEATGANAPEPDLLLKLACKDASLIAEQYGVAPPVASPGDDYSLQTVEVKQASAILAGMDDKAFIQHAVTVSMALWSGKADGLLALAGQFSSVSDAEADAALAAGNARRTELKHYSGGMFYYGDEWYWGVDRLHHLEQRLIALGLDNTPGEPLIAPRPDEPHGPLQDDGRITLEIYPSLRSPYTAIAFDRTVELAEQTGVTLKVLPVLPMVMRGVPATMEKGKYILFDTGREARAAGAPFGPCADPIGEPVRRAYSLWAWAREQGKAIEFFSNFLRCAWVEAINTNTDKGMREVVTRTGLSWDDAKSRIGQPGWEEEIETNRLAMYDMGLWGVPSYRVLNEQGEEVLGLWGQDRLWLVAQTIQKLLQNRATSA
ncbi:MAG: DsbA family protein [Pseudomonadota bacterium]